MPGNTIRKIFFLLAILAFESAIFSQSLTAVDERIQAYPSARFDSVKQLAGMIENDFETDMERVRAVYSWITHNVAYSYDARSTMNITYSSEEERIQKVKQYQERLAGVTLRSKEAVCHGYSMLFKELCDKLGIPCTIIRGFGKSFVSDIGSDFESNHAWNKVTIDNEDYLVDTTWGAGYMNGNRFTREVTYVYFLTDPEIFARNHYPQDPGDSLLEELPGKGEFLDRPLVYEDALENYFLNSPTSGLLRRKEVHTFEIESKLPINKLRIYYSGIWTDVNELRVENNRYTFDISLSNSTDDEMLLYIDKAAVFGFKVVP